MIYKDKELQCADCNKDFIFTAMEQEEFASRGYTNAPRRCTSCRKERKERQNSSTVSSNRNDSYVDKTRRQMFPAICSECKKETQVPFKPSENKLVYCSNCYNKIRTGK
jgi:CxxC-x17-CxxC domain-containing protein